MCLLSFFLNFNFMFAKHFKLLPNSQGGLGNKASSNQFVGIRKCPYKDKEQSIIQVSCLKVSICGNCLSTVFFQLSLRFIKALLLIILKRLQLSHAVVGGCLVSLSVLNFQVYLEFLSVFILANCRLIVSAKGGTNKVECLGLITLIFLSLFLVLYTSQYLN